MYTSSYTPTYYTSLHDSITSICKNLLPFSFKKRRLPAIAAAEQQLSKQQSDNLKWQQESFHQILKLMGLCKEGILAEAEVSAFKSHLLDTLVASPVDYEQPTILKDKLVFLQELLYGKCITEDEYHSSKRPLLQRLAVQGAEIEARDVIVSSALESSDEWSVVDLKDEKCLLAQESSSSKTKSKSGSATKQMKGSNSIFGFGSSHKNGKGKENKGPIDPGPVHFVPFAKNELGVSRENPFWDSNLRQKENETQSILMMESSPPESKKVENRSEGEKSGKAKKKMFRTLFQKEERHENGDIVLDYEEEKVSKSGKKQWGFDGFKKWKKSESEDETAPLPLSERSDSEMFLGSNRLVDSPVGEGPDTRQIKRKLHSNGAPSDFFVDKVLRQKIKTELSRIQTELNAKNPNIPFSNDQIDAISTRLPVDKADLKNFFPKSWCDRYGDVVLDVVRKEFKDHVGEMETMKKAAREKQNSSSSKRWATFDDDENCHPNLFAPQGGSFPMKQTKHAPLSDDRALKCFKNNPFFEDIDLTQVDGNKENPFWSPRQSSSMLG